MFSLLNSGVPEEHAVTSESMAPFLSLGHLTQGTVS